MEREQYQTEIRDLQDQLSEMHDELDLAKKSGADGEKDILMAVMQCSLFEKKIKSLSFCFKLAEQAVLTKTSMKDENISILLHVRYSKMHLLKN